MHGVVQTDDIVHQAGSSGGNHDVDTKMFPKRLADMRCLKCEFSRGDEDQSLSFRVLGIDAFQGGDDEGCGLSGTVLCASEDIPASESHGYCFFLNGRRFLKAGLEYAHHELSFDVEIFEFKAFGSSHILKQSQCLVM